MSEESIFIKAETITDILVIEDKVKEASYKVNELDISINRPAFRRICLEKNVLCKGEAVADINWIRYLNGCLIEKDYIDIDNLVTTMIHSIQNQISVGGIYGYREKNEDGLDGFSQVLLHSDMLGTLRMKYVADRIEALSLQHKKQTGEEGKYQVYVSEEMFQRLPINTYTNRPSIESSYVTVTADRDCHDGQLFCINDEAVEYVEVNQEKNYLQPLMVNDNSEIYIPFKKDHQLKWNMPDQGFRLTGIRDIE